MAIVVWSTAVPVGPKVTTVGSDGWAHARFGAAGGGEGHLTLDSRRRAPDHVGMTGQHPAVVETHSSIVLFVGDRAFKMKKAVDFGFLDFRTREAREAACHREVELNRRLAPDVYLGVADVLGLDKQPCDHLVVMRRMPLDRRLSTLVTSGVDVESCLREIARTVADFHSTAERPEAANAVAEVDAVLTRWEANAGEMERFTGSIISAEVAAEATERARRYLTGRRPLFDQRIADGLIRDGHGDLLADDVFCLDDGPRILDCLEFDDQLRYGDILADASFLAMDLERLGRPDLGGRFLGWWSSFVGESHPQSLAHYYEAYRAQVRAKVSCLRHEQGDAGSADEARDLMELCRSHLDRGRVRLILIGGLPGTGKSTLAAGVAQALELPVVRSDEVRKELAGVAAGTHSASGLGEGIYSSDHTTRTYLALLGRAAASLGHGRSIMLDASWSQQTWRDMAAEVARSTASDLVELRCVAPASMADRRIASRSRDDPSDATSEVAHAMAGLFDRWPSATEIDTAGAKADSLSAALHMLGEQQ